MCGGGRGGVLRGRHELGVRGHVALVQEAAALLLVAVAEPVLEHNMRLLSCGII